VRTGILQSFLQEFSRLGNDECAFNLGRGSEIQMRFAVWLPALEACRISYFIVHVLLWTCRSVTSRCCLSMPSWHGAANTVES
jgi:hypothetical protein